MALASCDTRTNRQGRELAEHGAALNADFTPWFFTRAWSAAVRNSVNLVFQFHGVCAAASLRRR